MHLIVGLGNPGRKYDGSRHNMGFEVVDEVSRENIIRFKASKFSAYAGEGYIGLLKTVLMKPTTYMNRSGEAVRDFVRYYKMPMDELASKLIIVYDDVSLPVGRIRIRERGSAGGHNGIKSILYQLETEDFIRVRVGVGGKPEQMALSDHVLGRVKGDEAIELSRSVLIAARAVEDIMRHGAGFAMNKYNVSEETKVKKEKKEDKAEDRGDLLE